MDGTNMKHWCEKHGEVERMPPNIHGDCYCPRCFEELLQAQFNEKEGKHPTVVSARVFHAMSMGCAVAQRPRCSVCSGTGVRFFLDAERLSPDGEGFVTCCVIERCDVCRALESDAKAVEHVQRRLNEGLDSLPKYSLGEPLVPKAEHAPIEELEEALVRAYKALSSTFKHKRSGVLYHFCGLTIDERTQGVLVSYKPASGRTRVVFSRPLAEFLERFERLGT